MAVVSGARAYLLEGLAATPVVVDRLLASAIAPDLDVRPDPERYNLREMLAHLADWEDVWLERFRRILAEREPVLPNLDPDLYAAERRWAEADSVEQQERFRLKRAEMVSLLRGLDEAAWARTGIHGQWGPLTVGDLAVIILGHDGYHTRQLSEWLDFGSLPAS